MPRGGLHVRSPDGCDWLITVHRVQLPRWPDSGFDLDDWTYTFPETIFAYLVLAPVFWFIIPLLRVLAALPLALARSVFSSTRWVEAECRWPSEIRIRWETTRDRAHEIAREIAGRLPSGYSDLTPAGATLVSMTRPPGIDDLSA